MESLAIIIPVFNEEAIIAQVLRDWKQCLDGLSCQYKIYVYDDGSTDNTLRILQQLQMDLPSLEIFHKTNQGHGPTILLGYNQNISSYDWLFQVDGDNEIPATNFLHLWHSRRGYDLVVGGRLSRRQSLERKILSQFSRFAVHQLFSSGIWDVNSPFRLMRTSAVKPIIESIPLTTFAPNLIISGMAAMRLNVLECPVAFQERKTGHGSIRPAHTLFLGLLNFKQLVFYKYWSNVRNMK